MKRRFFLSGIALMISVVFYGKEYTASDHARFTILSCTSGPDLYSIFGHTAIRYEDTLNGKKVDWVFNYGTFEFSDDFYWKFAQGKLDYKLSLEDFGSFQQEYIYTGRGIFEQELILTADEKRKLFELLEENYQPENRVYRYDFFYDNCATRVRDIILKSLSRSAGFTYVYARPYTFREAIQHYLDHMPWSDFGIDLALGMPCDREVEKGQMMFLPDSLMKEFNYASAGTGALAARASELLPAEYELHDDTFFTPVIVFGLLLLLQFFAGWWWVRKGKTESPVDRVLLFVTGIIGVVVFFLWFLTDHTATRWNLNIIWANPLHLILVFMSWKKRWISLYMKFLVIILFVMICCWFFLPQTLHLAVMPMVIGLIYIGMRQWHPGFFIRKNLGTSPKSL